MLLAIDQGTTGTTCLVLDESLQTIGRGYQELRQHFPDAKVDLKPSSGGRFEVSKDGSPIFQKSKLGRHAEPGEIVGLLRAAV